MRKALTLAQRRIKRQIEEIAKLIQMDHWNIESYDPESRTPHLTLMLRAMVNAEVISRYTLIDEYLTLIICHLYFDRPERHRSYRELWRTKKFRLFNHHLMEDVYLLGKLRLVHATKAVPSEVRHAIERINALRNALAHSFFPENRRQYSSYKKVVYQGSDIYTVDGVVKMSTDFDKIRDYLQKRAFGV